MNPQKSKQYCEACNKATVCAPRPDPSISEAYDEVAMVVLCDECYRDECKALNVVDREKVLQILENMPTGTSCRIKIGENDYALKALKKNQPTMTMQDIKDYNNHSKGYNEGYKAAIEKMKDWRNEQFLLLKHMK